MFFVLTIFTAYQSMSGDNFQSILNHNPNPNPNPAIGIISLAALVAVAALLDLGQHAIDAFRQNLD